MENEPGARTMGAEMRNPRRADDWSSHLGETSAAAFVDEVPNATLIIEAEKRTILAISDETLRVFGYRLEELLGQPLDALLDDEACARIEQAKLRSVASLQPTTVRSTDAHARRKDGSGFPFEMQLAPLVYDAQSVIVVSLRDISQPRRLARQYQMLFEASPLSTWIIDRATGRFLLVNNAALRQYGYTRDEFLAMPIESLRLPEETGQLTKYVRAQAAGPFVAPGLWHHRRKDGSVFQVQLTVEHITFGGRPAILTLVLDPEREGALDALKIRERQLAEAQALAHVGSWEWDIPANHATWSDEMYRICDVPLGSPAGYKEFMDRVHPDDRERVANLIADGLARRCPSAEYECRIVRPRGGVRYLLKRHAVICDATGQPLRMAGTCLDITDRRRMEQVLADSERQHRELVENAPDIVTIVSAEGVVLYMSPSVKRVLGYETSDLLGHTVFDFIHPDDAPSVLDVMRRNLEAPGVSNVVELRFQHQDGSWRVLEAIGQAREERPGVYTHVVNSRDVTDRKVAEERQQALMHELQAANRAAEEATRAKSEFLANMSHEIRTPMNAVLGLTELLLDTGLTDEQRRHLEMVRESGDVLLRLLDDILDLSKIEAGHVDFEAIPFDLVGLVHSTASLFAIVARERSLELLVDVAQDVPRYVRGDPTRVRQVLSNLLGNAAKFTHEGEIVLSATLVQMDGARAALRFAVRDTGIGIPPDKQELIFREFSQVDASTTRRYGGTGLGLAIGRRLVRLMGGELAVTSEVGRGSEFCFTLTMPVEAEPVSQTSAAPIRLAGTRALLVDDNATNRRIVRQILAPLGAVVDEVSSAGAALPALERALDETPYAVVLLDSQMPERDGWTLAEDIKRHPKLAQTRLLMLTSAGQRGDAEKCRAIGIEGYLIKPVSRNDLVEAVASVLAGKRPLGTIVTRHALTEARAHLSILLAEDNHVNQEVALAMLSRRGHNVTVVENGAKAVTAAANASFDVVLMDIHMPEMDGFAAAAAIRKLPGRADLPIIALTADALSGERERCLAAGMSGYLSKPFKAHDLFAIVEGWGTLPEAMAPNADTPLLRLAPADIVAFRDMMRQADAEDAVDGILDAFTSDAPQRIAALASALASGCARDIQTTAHAFKSAAGAIGARDLASILLRIELAAQEERVDDARSLSANFQTESEAVITHLRGLRVGVPIHA